MADFEQTAAGVLLPANFSAATNIKNPSVEMREIATTLDGRDITRGYVDAMALQPTTDNILELRGGGNYDIYKQVLRDDQVSSCFNQRQLAVCSKEFAVDAGGKSAKDKAAAAFIEEQLHHIGWDRVTSKMMYGVFYGFAVAEAMWARDSRFIVLEQIKVRNRQRFGFDGANQLRMKTFANPDGELMPDRKFWHFTTGGDHDDEPYGIGLGHWLYWPAFFKRNGIKYWLTFLEKFGSPTGKGTYPAGALPAERNKLLQALSAIATDTGIIVPEGMQIELLEASRSGTADYTALYDRMDRAIAKVVLGQVGSTEGTPGKLGNDELQSDVRDDIIKADADLICESFNRSIVRWLTEWNFPGAAVPRVYRKCEPEEDQNKKAERDNKICTMGFKPTLKHIQDEYGGDWVEKEEKPPVDEPQQLPGKADEAKQTKKDKAAPADFAAPQDETITGLLDDRLQPITGKWLGQIRELVETADSLEQIRDGLEMLLPEMKLEDYSAMMGEALRVAELAGRDDIMSEATNAR